MRERIDLSKSFARTRRGLFALLAVGTLTVCVSCAQPTPALEGPYAAEYARAIEESDSEFVKAILSDGVIEETEFLEAVSKANQCLSEMETGVTITYDNEYAGMGWMSPGGQLSPETAEAVEQCNRDWLGEIGNLFTDALENPNNEAYEDILAECLVRHGIAPEGFTGDVYIEMNYRPEYRMYCEVDGESGKPVCHPPQVELNGVVLPDGSIASALDPEVWGCISWPMR